MIAAARRWFVGLCVALPVGCAQQPVPPAAPAVEPQSEAKVATQRSDLLIPVKRALTQYTRFPKSATGSDGTASVQVTINRAGEVVNNRLVKSTGNSDLDEEATAVWKRMMRAGVRFPSAPGSESDSDEVSLVVPISFCSSAACRAAEQANREKYMQAVALYQLAYIAFNKGLYQEAIDDDAKAIDLSPQALFFVNRGWNYYKTGQYAPAEADFTKAIELDPKYCLAYNDRGVVHSAQGDNDLAISDFNKTIELCPDDPQAYHNQSDVYLKEGAGDKALATYTRLIAQSPSLSLAYNNRAWIYHLTGRAAEGLADADKAIELDPRAYDYLDTRAHLYEDLGQRDKAVADYQAALSLNPNSTASQDGFRRVQQAVGESLKP